MMKYQEIAKLLDYVSSRGHAFYGMIDENGNCSDVDYGLNLLRQVAAAIKVYGIEEFLSDVERQEAARAVLNMEDLEGWTA